MTVTFAGHSDVTDSELVKEWLKETVREVIHRGANQFLLGGYGSFDCMAATVVKDLQGTYPDIKSFLVIPYVNRGYDTRLYTNSVFPPHLVNAPPRAAIPRRNQWMVEVAKVVIAYVLHEGGGAATTLKYAHRKNKEIIQYRNQTYGA